MIFLSLVDLISKKLNEFTPSEADIELRTLSPEGGGEIQLMANFMKSLSTLLLRGKDYELMQAYITLFIKVSFLFSTILFVIHCV